MSLEVRYKGTDSELVFSGSALSGVNLVTEADPSLCSITADSLSFTIQVEEGTTLDLQEGQRVELYKDGDLEHTQFVKDFERLGRNRYRLVCQSRIGVMNDTYYGKIHTPGGPVGNNTDGYYSRSGNLWRTASFLLDQIASESHCSTSYTQAGGLEDTVVAGYLPICSQRDALQQVAFAAGLLVSARDGNLNFHKISPVVSGSFVKGDIFYGGKVKEYPLYHEVSVNSLYENYVDQAWKDEQPEGEAARVEISRFAHMSEVPVIDLSSDLEVVSETDYGAKWYDRYNEYEVPSGDQYIEFQKKIHTRTINTATGKKNTLSVGNCTLLFQGAYYHDWKTYDENGDLVPREKIYTENVQAVLDRLEAYAGLRVLVEQEVIVRDQRAGDYVRTVTPWDTYVEGYIISMDSTLTQNGHRARVKILGKHVDYTPEYSSRLGEFI